MLLRAVETFSLVAWTTLFLYGLSYFNVPHNLFFVGLEIIVGTGTGFLIMKGFDKIKSRAV
ncbi:hypothetical protein CN918_28760 [Priestia megaterium]|nr:hypothetical protein CN918_28760 [Priestia megaterium]